MKPASFDYLQPTSLQAALEAKHQHGEDARFLAGGQSLVPAMNFRMAQPQVLIDINGLTEYAGIEIGATGARIGALTRYRDLERHGALLAMFPLLADALPLLAHPQIRSRGTIGGNLAHADPSSEMPAILIALRARLKAASLAGERWMEAETFFTGTMSTALQQDEMLVQVAIEALPSGSGMAFAEIARRRGDFAIAGVAVAMTLAGNTCESLRVALCGLSDHAFLAPQGQSLIGAEVSDAALEQIACAIAAALDPPGSLHAAPGYQRHVARVLCESTLRKARDRALMLVESK
jgi:carbon-monoxide dehydrogenase medium subunit